MRIERVAIARERYVVLTGGYIPAVILNQLIYWQSRTNDVDAYIREERRRMTNEGESPNIDVTHGWMYKTADDLSEETMLGLSRSNMRVYIKQLVAKGWVEERSNPVHKWDRTIQYRVNLTRLRDDLRDIGFDLDGWVEVDVKESALRGSVSEHSSSILELQDSNLELQSADLKQQYQRVSTESTTKTTLPPTPLTDQTSSPREGEERGRNGKSSQTATQSHQPSRKITNAYVTALGKVFHTGKTPEQLTDPAWEELTNVAKQLERTGDAPEEIAIRAARWNTHYPNAGAITKTALLKHWSMLANDPPPKPADRNDRSRWEMNGCVYAREEEDGSRSWPPGYRPSQADINMGKIIGKDGKMKSVWVG